MTFKDTLLIVALNKDSAAII